MHLITRDCGSFIKYSRSKILSNFTMDVHVIDRNADGTVIRQATITMEGEEPVTAIIPVKAICSLAIFRKWIVQHAPTAHWFGTDRDFQDTISYLSDEDSLRWQVIKRLNGEDISQGYTVP